MEKIESFAPFTGRIKLHPSTLDHLKKFYPNLDELLLALSTPPCLTTLRVNTLREDATTVAHKLQQHLDAKSTGHDDAVEFTKDQPYGSVQPHPVLPDVITLKCIGPLTRTPSSCAIVLVDQACAEAVLRGADIFAAGVLAASRGIHKGDLVSVYADLEKKATRGEFVDDAAGRGHIFIGNGIIQHGRGTLFSVKSGIAVVMTEKIFDTPPLNGVLEDLLFLQNIPSMVVAHVLDPRPGEMVLDMCSAPGGKTTHIAALSQDKAHIVALEKSPEKVEGIRKLCQRLGINSVKAIAFDSTKALLNLDSESPIDQEPLTKKPKVLREDSSAEVFRGFPPQTFDRILLDPPCSGLGNRPRLQDKQTVANLKGHAAYQRKLIHTAVALLKKGGTLVYSTCTINPLENEELVAYVLSTYSDLQLVEQRPYLGQPGLASTSLTEDQRLLVQRFDPTVSPEMTGFFIAKFMKA